VIFVLYQDLKEPDTQFPHIEICGLFFVVLGNSIIKLECIESFL